MGIQIVEIGLGAVLVVLVLQGVTMPVQDPSVRVATMLAQVPLAAAVAVGMAAVLVATMAAMVQEAVALPTCGTAQVQAIIALMVVLLQSNLVA